MTEHATAIDWNFTVSLFANTSMAIAGTVFGVMAARELALRYDKLFTAARMGLAGMVMLGWFLFARVGYWSPTMWLSSVNSADFYHEGWRQFRMLSYAPASVLGMAAVWFLMRGVFPWPRWVASAVVAVSALLGLLVAVSWQASEMGYWFDRAAVIRAHDCFFNLETCKP